MRGAVEEPFAVVVDPAVSFGRPVLEGTGIPTEILAQRYKAGDSYEQLVEDYRRPKEEIEKANVRTFVLTPRGCAESRTGK